MGKPFGDDILSRNGSARPEGVETYSERARTIIYTKISKPKTNIRGRCPYPFRCARWFRRS